MKDSRDSLPPHNTEAEKVLLGICFLEPSFISDFLERGLDEMFYDLRNQVVFRAMTEAKGEGLVPDPATIHSQLKGQKDFHFDYFIEITNSVDSVHNHEYWFSLVEESFLARRVCQVAMHLYQESKETNSVSDLISHAQTEILSLGLKKTFKKDRVEQFREIINTVEDFYSGKKKDIGLKTGYLNLDKFFPLGLSPGQLIVIAGRPGMGKSTLALNILENISYPNGNPTGFISLEMSEMELNFRTIARYSGVPTSKVFDTELMDQGTLEKVGREIAKCSKAPIHIEVAQDSSMNAVRSIGRRLHSMNGAKCLVVDYIQRIRTGRRDNRNSEIEEITGSLKDMATELNIPVLALSQFNREVEKQERRPRLSDLRDGGSIEQDCDKAILLHQENEMEDRIITAIIGKNRGGEKGEAKLYFKKDTNHFQDYREPFK